MIGLKADEIKKKIKEEVLKGNVVIIHPAASKKFKGGKVAAIDYPR